jgi:hypothetical protein
MICGEEMAEYFLIEDGEISVALITNLWGEHG